MYNYFPNCQLYLINYPPGGCGSLIVSVISYMLFPDKELPDEVSLSNAHYMTTIAKETHELSKYQESRMDMAVSGGVTKNLEYFTLPLKGGLPLYQIVKPKDTNGYMILWDHSVVYNYNSLTSLYPNFTEIVVTVKPEDKPQYDFTCFLKFGEADSITDWRYIQEKVSSRDPINNWILNFSTPKELINDKEHLKLFASLDVFSTELSLGDFLEPVFAKHKIKNHKFTSRINSLDFKTILSDADTTLNQISEIVKTPVTEKAKIVYDRWINKQILLDTLMGK